MSVFKNIILFFAVVNLLSCQSSSHRKKGENSIITSSPRSSKPVKFIKKSGPKLLSPQQLRQLAEKPKPTNKLATQYHKLLTTPFIDNSAYFRSGMPKALIYPSLGPSLRVTTWNIEKSIKVPEVAKIMTSQASFENMMKSKIKKESATYNKAIRQQIALAASDILILQEMDIGHRRSGYHFAAKHLAQKLGMNFVYAPQQLELDPHDLGLDPIRFGNGDTNATTSPALSENSEAYRGVFGVAVLSHYPIKSAKLFQLQTQPYDWYHSEILKPDLLEIGRRQGSKTLFKFQPTREVKIGGRAFTRVDLHVPGIPLDTLSIINIHLEIKTTPKNRQRQIKEILGYIKGIKNPVIMAGDFNSSSSNVSSTSFKRFSQNTATDPSRLLSAGLFLANITGINQVRGLLNTVKNYTNPLAWNIPVILPNKTRELFTTIKNFRFDDGGAFDFRGNSSRSTHKKRGALSNSNQRQGYKGFTFTYSVPRSIGPIGRERLDWIFVKSFLSAPFEKNGSYRLAPHYGETLDAINSSVKDAFSDHHPITTLLPLGEPPAPQ